MGDQKSRGGKGSKGQSVLEKLMQTELQAKSTARQDNSRIGWLQEGIVVKVLSKGLKEHGYYKRKGVVCSSRNKVGELQMLDSNDIIRVDQRELETVLPQIGGSVMVLNGRYKRQVGVLLGVNLEKYKAEIELSTASTSNSKIWLDYEDVCKIYRPS